jgi:hypothetical protein
MQVLVVVEKLAFNSYAETNKIPSKLNFSSCALFLLYTLNFSTTAPAVRKLLVFGVTGLEKNVQAGPSFSNNGG